MIHPLPPGTRDVLPEEMRELRTLTERLRGVFEGGGYGEVWTPALEYEEVLRRGDARDAAGLRRHRIGLGDGSLYRRLLDSLEVPQDERRPMLEALSRRDLVGI